MTQLFIILFAYFVQFTDKMGSNRVALSDIALEKRTTRGIAIDSLDYAVSPIYIDSLRLEKWYCLYGHDIDDTTSPLEAGLGWITKFDAKDFIDKEFLLKQKAEGVQRKLVHFECQERAIPRCGYELCDAEGNTIGNVTSGIMLPTTKVGIGMGYVKTAFAKKETIIYVKIREKLIPAKIV